MSKLEIIRGEENAPIEPLLSSTVAVLGFGNQGAAHAMNLRDSGVRVIVGHRTGTKGEQKAREAEFPVMPIAEAAGEAELCIVALPDEVQPDVYEHEIASKMRRDATLGFLHGLCIRYEQIKPPVGVNVIMIAPKGPGATLRERFMQGLGIPCLMAVHQQRSVEGSDEPSAEAIALAWANGIGCARAGIVRTTFADETETDLFGEQAVLCGGMTWLMMAAFETLVEAGYPPELAYLECCHEVKQVADLMYEQGIAAMMDRISNTAEFGAHVAGPFLVDDAVRSRMKLLLQAIKDGSFAARFREDYGRGFDWFNRQRQSIEAHQTKAAGGIIRDLMPKNRRQ